MPSATAAGPAASRPAPAEETPAEETAADEAPDTSRLPGVLERGSTVIVSTATIALQRQLVDRDLPRLAKALTPLLGRAPTFAILKGRRNYLCLHKLSGPDDVDDADQLFDPFAVS